MNKITLKGDDARKALLAGITKLNDMVAVTLGPAGRNIIFAAGNQLISTKDGVTVAREMSLKDPFENYGAETAKSVAGQAVDQAGDGTTTATLLIKELFEGGVKAIEGGFEPTRIAKGIRKAAAAIVGTYDEKAKRFTGGYLEQFKVETTPELAFHVAKISANGDEDIARVVSDAVLKVGAEGAISIGTAPGTVHQLEMVEGLQLDTGLAHGFFVNDPQRNRAVYNDCLVFVLDRRLSTQPETLAILKKGAEQAQRDNKTYSILVIANDIDPQALMTMVGNKVQNGVNIVAVTSPSWGPHRTDALEDICLITGAKRIDCEKGKDYDKLSTEAFGHAARVVVTQQKTVITAYEMGKFERQSRFEPYVARVRALSEDPTLHPADRDRAKQRLAALAGGVAVVKVGGNSGDEVKERGFRVEDAIHATRAAVADGVVPGGGSALLFAGEMLEDELEQNAPTDESEAMGAQVVVEAMSRPLAQIVRNAGADPERIVGEVIEASEQCGTECGFDASLCDILPDMVAAGIVDPLKVVRSSLNAAATAAAQLLLTEGIIAFEPVSPATETRLVAQ